MGMLGIVSGIILNIVDLRSRYHVLNLPDRAVQAILAAEAAAAKGNASDSDSSHKALDFKGDVESLESPLLQSS